MTRTRTFLLCLFAVPMWAQGQVTSAESGIVIDASSGKTLWSRNADEELYPASTTKIMTSLLLLEHCQPDDVIVAPADVQKVRESSMHLKPFERIRAKDMLFALMLRSANDGCYAVACHISGSVQKFSELMNRRAKELGCTHTHFDNPNGLNDPLHYTTAHDLAAIARQAMEYPVFRNIVRTEKIKINRSANWKDLWMVNHDKLLFHDPTCDGIKTGWTIPAGHCFVGSASRDGWRVITVVMKDKHWQADTEGLFSWAYDHFEVKQAATAGESAGEIKVTGGTQQAVATEVADDAYSLVPRRGGGTFTTRFEMPNTLAAPIAKSQKIGDLVVRDPDGYEHKVDVIASETDPARGPPVASKTSRDFRVLLGAGLVAGAMLYRGRTRKRLSTLSGRRARR